MIRRVVSAAAAILAVALLTGAPLRDASTMRAACAAGIDPGQRGRRRTASDGPSKAGRSGGQAPTT